MLEIRGLCAGYGSKEILRDVSVDVPEGTVSVLLGPNGCGKSTLLKSLCGIITPTGGTARLDGEDLLALESRPLARKVAYLAQDRRVPDITVERLVLHGRFPHLGYPRRYRPEDYAAADSAMERMGLSMLAEEPLSCLSGGQRQKVYIAMALAQDTPVILLDEPTTYLDVAHQLQMLRLARMLAEEGKTVLMVLHDLPHAMTVADRIILLEEGRVAARGEPEEVYTSGMIDRVFGVCLCRMETAEGWQYYYRADGV